MVVYQCLHVPDGILERDRLYKTVPSIVLLGKLVKPRIIKIKYLPLSISLNVHRTQVLGIYEGDEIQIA